MALNNPYSAYQKTNITTASQGHLVVLLYEAAVRNLNNAVKFFDENDKIQTKDIEEFSKCIQKTQAIINELQTSLDMEKGGEIAQNLMSLYIYFNKELLDSIMNHNKEKITSVSKMMQDLLSAWRQAANSTANAPAQTARTTLDIQG